MLNCRFAGLGVGFGRVFDGWVDVSVDDGEVDEVEIDVVDALVLKLAFADRFDALGVVEGVPELGDEEELRAGDEAFVYGARDTEAELRVRCRSLGLRRQGWRRRLVQGMTVPHAPSSRR